MGNWNNEWHKLLINSTSCGTFNYKIHKSYSGTKWAECSQGGPRDNSKGKCFSKKGIVLEAGETWLYDLWKQRSFKHNVLWHWEVLWTQLMRWKRKSKERRNVGKGPSPGVQTQTFTYVTLSKIRHSRLYIRTYRHVTPEVLKGSAESSVFSAPRYDGINKSISLCYFFPNFLFSAGGRDTCR